MPDNEWLWLRLAADRIGAARLLPAWREGTLRGVPSETIARGARRIGVAKLGQAWLEGTLPLRGIKHGMDEEIDIPRSEAGRLALDCSRNRVVRLSSRGLRRLIEYHSVKAKLAAVERLEREAKPPPKQPEAINREREKKAARKEAARAWMKQRADRAREGAERAAEFERLMREDKATPSGTPPKDVEPPAPANAPKRGRGRPRGQPTTATRDAKTMNDFQKRHPDGDAEQHLRDTLKGRMRKESVSRRLRRARAVRDADK